MNNVHVTVLAEEICQWLSPKPGGIYVDCTLGVGGTSLKILESSGNNAYILGLDRDPEALAYAEKNLEPYRPFVKIYNGNYSHIVEFVHQAGFEKVDGVVFDLGVSSLQLDKPERGFSFSSDGPLDMRMNQTQGPRAADLVNCLPEKELADLFFYVEKSDSLDALRGRLFSPGKRLRWRQRKLLSRSLKVPFPTPIEKGEYIVPLELSKP